MPTLMSNVAAVGVPRPQPQQEQRQPPTAAMLPSSLTLSFAGVQFSLTPKDTAVQLAYKIDANGHIVLDLANFSGTLQVAPTSPWSSSSTLMTSSTNTNSPSSANSTAKVVVEEPNSPENNYDNNAASDSMATVTPGQQKLSFQKHTRTTNKKDPSRKRSNGGSTTATSHPSSSFKSKKARHEAETSIPPSPPPLQQSTMEVPTQMEPASASAPDFSQTMPSTNNNCTTSSSSPDDNNDNMAFTEKSTVGTPPGESVQDILKRVNSSNDSVTEGDDILSPTTYHQGTTTPTSHGREDDIDHRALDETPIQDNTTETTTDATAATGTVAYSSPSPRWGHTMTQLKNDRLLIYGGQSIDLHGNSTLLSDVHVYNTSQQVWEKPIHCRGEARQWHSATFLPERQLLLAFGGETTIEIKAKNKTKTKVVTSDSLKVLDTEIMLWYPPAVSGDVPSGRSGHTATLIPSTNEVVLFGGVKGSKWLNTVTILDTVRWIWSTPKILGSAPKPRSYHSATAVRNNNSINQYKVVVFGGNNKTSCFNTVHVLEMVPGSPDHDDTTTVWKWSHPSVQGQAPFPRTGHSTTLMEDGKTLCIHGGWDPNNNEQEEGGEIIFQSSFLLDTETFIWSKGPKARPGGSGISNDDDTSEGCGPKRCGHTASMHSETGDVLLFGGRLPGERLAGDFQRLVANENNK